MNMECRTLLFLSSAAFLLLIVVLAIIRVSHDERLSIRRANPHPSLTFEDIGEIASSASHCFGSNQNENTAWEVRTCHYKNLCFEPATKRFIFVLDSRASGSHGHTEPAMISARFDRWTLSDVKHLEFQPVTMTRQELFAHNVTTFAVWPSGEIITIYQAFLSHNVGHLFLEDYWTSYFNAVSIDQDLAIRPLWRNSEAPDPPWASCDWSRKHWGPGHRRKTDWEAKLCDSHNARWLTSLLGINIIQVLETSKAEQWSDSSLHCFPHSVVGAGVTRNAIGGNDADHGPNRTAPVTFGRGPLLLAFNRQIMRNFDVVTQKRAFIAVVFSSTSSKRLRFHFSEMAKAIQTHRQTKLDTLVQTVSNGRFRNVLILDVVLAEMSPKEQVDLLANQPTVFVTASGGGAFVTWFLQPGSAVIFLTKDDRNDDWKAYQSMHWIRTNYLDSKTAMTAPVIGMSLEGVFMQKLVQEIVGCALFSR